MTQIEKDMKAISLFAPRFFGLLSVLIAALPILDRLVDLLPPILRYRDLASALATIAAYAVIATDIVNRQRNPLSATIHKAIMNRLGKRPSTGGTLILFGVLAALGFIRFADPILLSGSSTTPNEEAIGIALYIVTYVLLALGFWWLSLIAYDRRNRPIQP